MGGESSTKGPSDGPRGPPIAFSLPRPKPIVHPNVPQWVGGGLGTVEGEAGAVGTAALASPALAALGRPTTRPGAAPP